MRLMYVAAHTYTCEQLWEQQAVWREKTQQAQWQSEDL